MERTNPSHYAEAARDRIVADSTVTGQNADERRRLAEELERREVNCVERSNGLDRKGSTGPTQDLVSDRDDVDSFGKGRKGTSHGSDLRHCQSARRPGTYDRPARLGECQHRGDSRGRIPKSLLGSGILLEKSCE